MMARRTLCMTLAVVVSGVTFNTTKSSTPQLPLATVTTRSRRRRLFAPLLAPAAAVAAAEAPTAN